MRCSCCLRCGILTSILTRPIFFVFPCSWTTSSTRRAPHRSGSPANPSWRCVSSANSAMMASTWDAAAWAEDWQVSADWQTLPSFTWLSDTARGDFCMQAWTDDSFRDVDMPRPLVRENGADEEGRTAGFLPCPFWTVSCKKKFFFKWMRPTAGLWPQTQSINVS